MMFPKVQMLAVQSGARIVLLGDPHGDFRTAQRIADREKQLDARTVIACVGDAIGYEDGPTSSAMVEWLELNKIPMVLGNHEEWYFNDNRLSVVNDRHAPKTLTESATAWISTLPHRIDIVCHGAVTPAATIVHSIRTPFWDDVQPHSVSRLTRALPGIGLVFIGHSHCARVMKMDKEGVTSLTSFDYTKFDSRDVDIHGVATAIVDAGSISRPRIDLRQVGRESTYGTYAVVDLASRVAGLRRIERAGH